MNGRTLLAEKLEEALPTWQIVSDARAIDTVRKPGAVALWTSKRSRVELAQLSMLTDEVTAWVLSAATDIAKIEDDLDALLLEFFAVIEEVPQFSWSEAERLVLADKWTGWRVVLTCNYKIETEEE